MQLLSEKSPGGAKTLSDDPLVPISGQLSSEETHVFLDYLAGGVGDQRQLPEIFRALAEDMSDNRLQQVAKRLSDRLDNGDNLAEAFKSVQTVIPDHLQQALIVGVESGN